MARKPKRQVFHSILTKKDGWIVQLDKKVQSKHPNQKETEKAAIEAARAAYGVGGLGRQSSTARRDIRRERTYGKDRRNPW